MNIAGHQRPLPVMLTITVASSNGKNHIIPTLTLAHVGFKANNADQSATLQQPFLARDVIYTSRAYATMSVSVCLSMTEVNWRIIANLGYKFRSKFTAHCRRGEVSSQQQHLALC